MPEKKKEWLLLVLVLLVTSLFFWPVLKNDFVNWEDDVNITHNPYVKELNAANIKNIFTQTLTGGYRPLATLSFAIEYHFFGLKPGVYHFNNLLLHLLCTMLVFIFLRKLGTGLFITTVAALLFGIHPMRVESVAWITERKDVLYGFFYLLAMIGYIAFVKKRKPVFYILALLAFVFSLMSKIQAVTLPLVLILIDYNFSGRFRFRQIIDKIPFFLLSLVTGIYGIYILGSQGSLETNTVLPFFQRIFIGTYSFCAYLIKSVWPYELSAIYPNPVKLSVLFYISAAGVLLLAFLVYKSGRHRKELVFGTLFFLFNIVFMLQIVGAGQAFMADRFSYLSYIGLFFLIAWALNFLFTSRRSAYGIAVAGIYLTALGLTTWNRTLVWRNSETLFTDVLKKYPNSAIAHNNLGLYYRDQNQNEKAIAAYSRSIETNPAGYLGYSNRGEAWFEMGEIDKALVDMDMAIKLNPDNSKALSNRGAIWGYKKEYKLALDDLNKAIALDTRNHQAYRNRLLVYFSLGDYEKASADATSCLEINPGDAAVLNQRGLCFDRLNRNEDALADFNEAIRLDPGKGTYYQNRSYLLSKTGDFQGALKDILKAKELGIKVNPAYLNMLLSG